MILTHTEVIATLYKSPSTHRIIAAAIVRQVFALMASFTLYMPIKDIEMVMYSPGRGLFVSKFNLGFRCGYESTVLASPTDGGAARCWARKAVCCCCWGCGHVGNQLRLIVSVAQKNQTIVRSVA